MSLARQGVSNKDEVAMVIPLTQGYSTVVDAADFERLSLFKWHAQKNRRNVYAARKDGGETIYLHREIARAEDGALIDHEDGNTLNNRRSNLRGATHSQNSINRRTPNTNTSGFRGVSRSGNGWRMEISCNGVVHRKHGFPTKEEAARAYDAKAIELFGEFARTNFTDGR